MEQAVQTPLWIDLIAATVGGLAGVAVAANRNMDIVGLVGLGVLTGLGGGIRRDIPLSQVPAALDSPWLILATLGAAMAVFLFQRELDQLALTVIVLDAAVLATYGVAGTDKALVSGIGIRPAALVGVITAVGGGILRDLFITRTPPVFEAGGQLYAIAALSGIVIYIVLNELGASPVVAAIISVAVAFSLRMAAWHKGWVAPQPFDATQRVSEATQRFRGGSR